MGAFVQRSGRPTEQKGKREKSRVNVNPSIVRKRCLREGVDRACGTENSPLTSACSVPAQTLPTRPAPSVPVSGWATKPLLGKGFARRRFLWGAPREECGAVEGARAGCAVKERGLGGDRAPWSHGERRGAREADPRHHRAEAAPPPTRVWSGAEGGLQHEPLLGSWSGRSAPPGGWRCFQWERTFPGDPWAPRGCEGA